MSHQTKIEVIKILLSKGMLPEAEVFCMEHKVGRKTLERLVKGVKNENR